MFKRCCLALSLFTAAPAWAECECLWQGSFSDVQHETDLVVAGRIVSGKGNSVDLDISHTLRGSSPGERIRIWLKTADYCRPEAGLFPPESSWVMALQRIDESVPGGFNPGTPNISYGRIGDYQLSSCGGYWLQLQGNLVTGALVDSPRWVREPKMTPVLLDLVTSFVNGEVTASALLEASREDPALRELRLDTRAFLRGDGD
ncbi:delta-aminolevulinic acid dehydratase [Seongchinamella sediminis]|uniref:Delta-aminolevulinic acid dehydratase n=1 Tax=Seongchinamella sediminis TaxID=2283635 RepID=A0A3L7DZ47_9GAMM|nr:delta-aminolevulinic acid dehydratase [Seongchinamella sediminis]RLQ21132.1 delta-aminolevulinic acid dehydratase [Seongchinamella sediminis]